MLKKILPFTKKDSENLYESLNQIMEVNKLLENMMVKNQDENIKLKEKIDKLESQIDNLISHEKKAHEYEINLYNETTNLIKSVKKDNIDNHTEVIKTINNSSKNYDLKLNTTINKVYSEIHNIVKLMNKSMFLEIVSNHKKSLDKLLKVTDSKKEKVQ